MKETRFWYNVVNGDYNFSNSVSGMKIAAASKFKAIRTLYLNGLISSKSSKVKGKIVLAGDENTFSLDYSISNFHITITNYDSNANTAHFKVDYKAEEGTMKFIDFTPFTKMSMINMMVGMIDFYSSEINNFENVQYNLESNIRTELTMLSED